MPTYERFQSIRKLPAVVSSHDDRNDVAEMIIQSAHERLRHPTATVHADVMTDEIHIHVVYPSRRRRIAIYHCVSP